MAVVSPFFRPRGRRPLNFDRKMHFENIKKLFCLGIFKMKWAKSEEKIEFGGRWFSGGATLAALPLPPPNLKIFPEPLGKQAYAVAVFLVTTGL